MNQENLQTAFVFGCGYLGEPVCKVLQQSGWKVATLTRNRQRAKELTARGYEVVVGDWRDGRVAQLLPERISRVLIAVGHDSKSSASRFETYVLGLQRVLPRIPLSADLVYVSSTGVFHQDGGVWVDETSSTRPTSEGGAAHLAAEQTLWRYRRGGEGKTVVLRMAGLYGPGRVPRLAHVASGGEMAVPDGYLNLIYRSDALKAILRAWEHPQPSPLYVVSDGCPVDRREFYREVARVWEKPEPQFVTGGSGRSEGSKRVWSARALRDLLRPLDQPTYREGLRASWLAGLCQARA